MSMSMAPVDSNTYSCMCNPIVRPLDLRELGWVAEVLSPILSRWQRILHRGRGSLGLTKLQPVRPLSFLTVGLAEVAASSARLAGFGLFGSSMADAGMYAEGTKTRSLRSLRSLPIHSGSYE